MDHGIRIKKYCHRHHRRRRRRHHEWEGSPKRDHEHARGSLTHIKRGCCFPTPFHSLILTSKSVGGLDEIVEKKPLRERLS